MFDSLIMMNAVSFDLSLEQTVKSVMGLKFIFKLFIVLKYGNL